MKIAVNTRLLLKNRLEGIGWFTKETLRRITKEHPEHEFLFLFDRKFDPSYIFSSNVKGIVVHPQARHEILYKIFFNYSIPRVLKREKVDLFLSPDGFLSLRTKVPQLAVIHDLNFEHFPDSMPKRVSNYYRKFFPKFAAIAKRIATVSKYSKLDIANTYTINPNKIDVVYNGANELYVPLSEQEIKNVRAKYTNGLPYFLFIGSLHPRKNIVNLLKAYEAFRQSSEIKIPLVIVGEAMWNNKDVESQLMGMTFKEDIISLGRLQSDELKHVLASALALTFVPLFEGFGIPALEAMQSGVPVIATNTSSLPEVVGEAAILCDPAKTEDIRYAMKILAEDEELRSKMVAKGLIQSKKFSWDQSAKLLWESIEKTMNDVREI